MTRPEPHAAPDRELLGRLRAADPARSLPPADPVRVARLLEDTLSADPEDTHAGRPDPTAPESRSTGLRDRGRLSWLVAAAVLALVAGVGAFVLLRSGEEAAPRATEPTTGPATASTTAPTGAGTTPTPGGAGVTQLAWPASAPGRCLPPSPDVISRQHLAVAATATSVAGGVVTLEPTEVYAGDPGQTIEVRQPSLSLTQLIGAPRFEAGGSYLLSATRGRLAVCGLSGPATPRLRALYDAAFGG